MVNILEEVDLHRIAWPIDRFDAIDHARRTRDEVAVEEGDRGVQATGQVQPAIMPGVEVHVWRVTRRPRELRCAGTRRGGASAEKKSDKSM